MTHDEGQVLPAANTALQVENMKLKRLVVELQGQVETLSKQLAELEKRQKTPSFVNANRLKKEGGPRHARSEPIGTTRRDGGKSQRGSRHILLP